MAMKSLVGFAVLAASAAVWAGPVLARDSRDFRLSAPRVAASAGAVQVSGQVCRLGLGRAGTPEVRLLRLGADGRILQSSAATLSGALRGRAGGCAVYAAAMQKAPPLRSGEALDICVSNSLGGVAEQCLAVPGV